MSTRGRGRDGFSLIEALVALAIASMTLMAIFELQIQMTRNQQRAALAIEQVAVQENALALTRSLNPMAQPQGRIELPGGDVVVWSSEPRGERRVNAGFPAGQGAFEAQLYRVTVEVERAQGRPPAPLIFDRVGWRRLLES
ncbi:prepilin-type N-terminal cleavage/methylation domain-containing protein [Brevundimonas sp.]|uniref:prepilin-type N-terminal cleavage/methylation domain-containing protein n=1 Tax=Brevundimonas sp. TaxID=1871086 RepID=UPI0028B09C52|nr:prepilin-type N-terminal cleavage/methylation domain-containing protein [Brevundimonas sp.]